MPIYSTQCLIESTEKTVFQRVAEPEGFVESTEHILEVEFLSETKSGVGTRFRETRMFQNRPTTTVLEITEYEPHSRVRFVSDQGGTIWDTVYEITPKGDQTKVSMEMEARPYQWTARLVTPWIMGMVGRAIESDLQGIKAFCESQ